MKIETWPIDKLKNWDQNPRNVSKEAFDRLKVQLHDLNLYKPLLIHTDGTVLGGNMRLRALKEKGVKDVVVSIVEAPDEETKLKYALSDNDQVGYTDKEKLLEIIEKYPDLELTHYAVHLDEPESLDAFMSQFKEIEEDEVPQTPSVATSKRGEVYQLGRHRLMCGDSIKIEDVEKLMDGKKADMVFTDPPYGVSLNETLGGDKDKYTELKNDNLSSSDLLEFNRIWMSNLIMFLKDWGVSYVFYSSNKVIEIRTVASELFKIKDTIIWVKDNFVLGRNDYKPQYEPILYLEKLGSGNVDRTWNGNFDQSNVWELSRDKNLKEHPTQKPVGLAIKAIKNSSKADDIVLDLFGGSGSTLIACEQTNRICYMMEIDEKYVDVIRRRYAKFINKEDTWQEITPQIL